MYNNIFILVLILLLSSCAYSQKVLKLCEKEGEICERVDQIFETVERETSRIENLAEEKKVHNDTVLLSKLKNSFPLLADYKKLISKDITKLNVLNVRKLNKELTSKSLEKILIRDNRNVFSEIDRLLNNTFGAPKKSRVSTKKVSVQTVKDVSSQNRSDHGHFIIYLLLSLLMIGCVGYLIINHINGNDKLEKNPNKQNDSLAQRLQKVESDKQHSEKTIREMEREIKQLNSEVERLKGQRISSQTPFSVQTGQKQVTEVKQYYHDSMEMKSDKFRIDRATVDQAKRSIYVIEERAQGELLLQIVKTEKATERIYGHTEVKLRPLFEFNGNIPVEYKYIITEIPALLKREGEYWVLAKKGLVSFQ